MNVNLTFWAKTASSKRTLDSQDRSSPTYKPVLHHLLDVGAVALRFHSENPARLRREAALLGLEPEGYARLMAFFAGLHDLGKLSRPLLALNLSAGDLQRIASPRTGNLEAYDC